MIDSHYHLDQSLVSVPGLVASMDRAGIEKTILIGAMCPPISLPRHARYVLPLFRRAVHADGGLVHRGGLAFYQNAVKPGGTVDLLGRRYAITSQPDNDAVLGAVKMEPERFFGLVFVNPEGPVDPVSEVERLKDEPWIVGVKAHPYWHDYPVARLADVAALCQDLELPMLLHLGTGERGDFRLLPELFPRLRVIYAHAGIPYGASVVRYARERKNVYVDLSAPSYVDLRVARGTVSRAGPGKCLFGSDGPYLHAENDRFDYSAVISILEQLPLSDREREDIAANNVKEVYGLS